MVHLLVRALVYVAITTLCSAAWAGPLELRFLDVGQGDATLIRVDGKAALIDAGPIGHLDLRLKDLGVRTIDLLLFSHNHLDHMGGATSVLTRFNVRYFLDNGQPSQTAHGTRLLGTLRDSQTLYLKPTARTIHLSDLKLRIIPPPAGVRGDAQNNRSMVVLVERGKFRALFTGDSERGQIRALLKDGQIPNVDVLKAAHHGSSNGVSEAWLERTAPKHVVISVGADNNYGHPHAMAILLYEGHGAKVWRTDRRGDIVVTVDEKGDYKVRATRKKSKAR